MKIFTEHKLYSALPGKNPLESHFPDTFPKSSALCHHPRPAQAPGPPGPRALAQLSHSFVKSKCSELQLFYNGTEAKPPCRALWCLQSNCSYWHFSCWAENTWYNWGFLFQSDFYRLCTEGCVTSLRVILHRPCPSWHSCHLCYHWAQAVKGSQAPKAGELGGSWEEGVQGMMFWKEKKPH